MSKCYTPGIPASEGLKKELFNEVCPECPLTLNGQNKYHCAVVAALREGTLEPSLTAGFPCAEILFCDNCPHKTSTNEEKCLAEVAANAFTTETRISIFDKAVYGGALRAVPNDCPKGLHGLT